MRPPGSPEELQRRRERALSLLRQGYRPVEVAHRMGVGRRSVQRWKAAVQDRGRKAHFLGPGRTRSPTRELLQMPHISEQTSRKPMGSHQNAPL